MVTKEQILNARTYMGIVDKVQIAENMAELCVKRFTPTGDENKEPYWKENTLLKQMFLMGVFKAHYLRESFHPVQSNGKDIPFLMSADDYDRNAHIFNEIERIRQSGTQELKNICYDMLSDYKEFAKILSTEIYALLQARNDIAERFANKLDKPMSPEELRKMADIISQTTKVAENE